LFADQAAVDRQVTAGLAALEKDPQRVASLAASHGFNEFYSIPNIPNRLIETRYQNRKGMHRFESPFPTRPRKEMLTQVDKV
jgi:hypothetical protein